MATQPSPSESVADRFASLIGRWWRRAKYQWLNATLLIDLGVAVSLFGVVFFLALALPKTSSRIDSAAGLALAFFASLPPVLMYRRFPVRPKLPQGRSGLRGSTRR